MAYPAALSLSVYIILYIICISIFVRTLTLRTLTTNPLFCYCNPNHRHQMLNPNPNPILNLETKTPQTAFITLDLILLGKWKQSKNPGVQLYLTRPLCLLLHASFTSDLRSASVPRCSGSSQSSCSEIGTKQKSRRASWRSPGGAEVWGQRGEKGRQCRVIHVLGEGSEKKMRNPMVSRETADFRFSSCDWQQSRLVNRETADRIKDNINNQLVILSHWFYNVGI